MIFAILFCVSFIAGLVGYLLAERWWLGGVLMSLLILAYAFTQLEPSSQQGMAIYFGVPIAFFGSLFGAYIVQLRRAPQLDSEVAGRDDVKPDNAD